MFEGRNMMLVRVLVVIALLVSDVAGNNNTLEVEERLYNPHHLTQGHCDENWFYFPPLNTCNRFFRDQKTWKEAEEFCNQLPHYGNLATVTSNIHNIFIANVIRAVDANSPTAWIGLNDIWKEGPFTWSDGTSYTYRCWAGHQPDNHQGNEDCVHILSGSSRTWNDLPCGVRIGFVCAFKLHCT
ncbi:echinoidin-like [Hypanus sabinus]|uniref:echinoidin-like n=1 Tax=Hypanus sabinus TaxID=79690 RepID=UPI0028C4D96F|nr:echinoidin-like [Hypanus sabinus]